MIFKSVLYDYDKSTPELSIYHIILKILETMYMDMMDNQSSTALIDHVGPMNPTGSATTATNVRFSISISLLPSHTVILMGLTFIIVPILQ